MARNTSHLLKPTKGHRFGGRTKGIPNKSTRMLKEAILLAAETSVHSKSKDLAGYVKFLADKHPDLFTSLLGRLLPLQAKVRHEGMGNTTINVNMPLPEMVNNFERLIKSAYTPTLAPMIEHDPENA